MLQAKHDNCVMMDLEEFSKETPGWDGWEAASLKRLNPNAKVHVYYRINKTPQDHGWGKPAGSIPSPCNWECCMPWFEIDAHDWWLRDGNGNKVADSGGYYFLDIGKPGVKEKLVEYIKKRSAGKPIDGFILDGVDYAQIMSTFSADHPRPATYSTDDQWFQKAYSPYIEYVVSELHNDGYKFVSLCNDLSHAGYGRVAYMRTKIDINIYENWILNWDGTWKDSAAVEQRIQHPRWICSSSVPIPSE